MFRFVEYVLFRADFNKCELPEQLLKNLADLKLMQPTPVQCHALALIKQKHDLMCCSATGSGKTVCLSVCW